MSSIARGISQSLPEIIININGTRLHRPAPFRVASDFPFKQRPTLSLGGRAMPPGTFCVRHDGAAAERAHAKTSIVPPAHELGGRSETILHVGGNSGLH